MARFDVHTNPDGAGFLLVVQSQLLDHLKTRVVVPLLPRSKAPLPARVLNPVFSIGGKEMLMATQFIAAVPNAILTAPVTTLDIQRGEIVAALDAGVLDKNIP